MTNRLLRIGLFTFAALATGAAPAQEALTPEFVAQIVERAQEKYDVVGLSLAVVQNGDVLAMAAAGESRKGVPMTVDTLCNIASCSKAFTAASIALLRDELDLDWDDRVVDHIPEFKMPDPWITSQMTIRDLLSHRCGLKTFAGDLLWYGSDYDDAEVLRRLEKLEITQPFRGQFGYQNLMYMVAGMVVERRSGMSWEEFVEQKIFAPLGMKNSRASAQRLPEGDGRALPHIDGEPVTDHEFVAVKPAASIYSSASELTAWIRFMLAEGAQGERQIISSSEVLEMWKPHIQIGPARGARTGDFRSYGLGWFLSLERGKKVVEHDGGMPGFLSKVSLMPEEEFGFVVLNNSNDGIVNEAIKRAIFVARAGGNGLDEIDRIAKIAARMKRAQKGKIRQREAQRIADTKPSLPLADYTGSYEDEVYGPAEIELVGDALQVVLVPSKRRLFGTMSHWHRDTFRVDFPDKFLPFALFRFDFDHEGKIAGFRIDCPIADFDFGALAFKRQAR